MEKITYQDRDYWYTQEDIIDWWDDDVPMIISCKSENGVYRIYLNEYGDVDALQTIVNKI